MAGIPNWALVFQNSSINVIYHSLSLMSDKEVGFIVRKSSQTVFHFFSALWKFLCRWLHGFGYTSTDCCHCDFWYQTGRHLELYLRLIITKPSSIIEHLPMSFCFPSILHLCSSVRLMRRNLWLWNINLGNYWLSFHTLRLDVLYHSLFIFFNVKMK